VSVSNGPAAPRGTGGLVDNCLALDERTLRLDSTGYQTEARPVGDVDVDRLVVSIEFGYRA